MRLSASAEANVGGFLIFLAAVFAFASGVAFVLLISAWRRTQEHRTALIHAFARIEALERVISSITFGTAPEEAPAHEEARAAVRAQPKSPAPAPARAETPAAARVLEPAGADAFIARLAEAVTPKTAATAEAAQDETRALAPEIAPGPLNAPMAAPAAEPRPVPRPTTRSAPRIAFPHFSAPRPEVAALAAFIGVTGALLCVRAGAVTPLAGTLLAAAMGAGLVAFAEWRSARQDSPGPLLAATGILSVAVSLVAAALSQAGLSSIGAMAGLFGLGLFAILRAPAHGRLLYVLGLAIALTAPLFDSLSLESSALRTGGLGALAALCAHAARARNVEPLAWAGLAGALLWFGVATLDTDIVGAPAALHAGGLALLSVIAFAYGWESAHVPAQLPNFWRSPWPPSAIFGAVAAPMAAMLAALILQRTAGEAPISALGLFAIVAVAAACAALRPRYALSAGAVLAIAIGCLALWPGAPAHAHEVAIAGVLTIICALGAGVGLWLRSDARTLGATLALLSIVGVLAALQARATFLLAPWAWSAIAFACAAAAIALFLRARSNAPVRAAMPLGAALFGAAGLAFAAPPSWAAPLVALALPAIASVDLRAPMQGLRAAMAILSGFLALQIVLLAGAPAPISQRLLAYAAAIAAAAVTARLLADAPGGARRLDVQALTLFAFALAALGAIAEIFWALGGPEGAARLLQSGAAACIVLALASFMAWRIGPRPHRWFLSAETLLFGAGAFYAVIAGLVLFNPWWGVWPGAITAGWFSIGASYLAPGVFCGLYAWQRGRQGYGLRVDVALAAGLILLFAEMVLDIRLAFQAQNVNAAIVSGPEGWAYVVGALAFSGLVLLVAQERRSVWLRYVALCLALAALVKAALFDVRGFDGGVQIAMFAGLVALGAAIVALFRRFILPNSTTEAAGVNLARRQ